MFFFTFAENSDHSNNNYDQDGGELTINKKKKKRKGLLDGIFDDEMDLTSVEGQRLMKATSKNVGALKLVSVLVLQITVGLLISNEFARWTRFVITGCLTVSPIKAIEIQWNSSIKRTFFFFFAPIVSALEGFHCTIIIRNRKPGIKIGPFSRGSFFSREYSFSGKTF